MRLGVFPGQGVPASVVAEALAEDSSVIDEASTVLGYELRRRVDTSAKRPRGVLPTAVAQPAIFVASVIAFERARSRGRTFDALLGHSLGEYAALVAAEAIAFSDGLILVQRRAEAMEEAGRQAPGAMSAVIGMTLEDAESIASEVGAVVANDNGFDQVVLSGPDAALETAAARARSKGARCVLLDVAGAFHSPAMRPARSSLHEALYVCAVRCPVIPVISNVTARPYRSPGEVRKLLVDQLTSRVRFRECLENVWDEGVREYDDLGPGDVAGKLVARTFGRLSEAVAHV